MDDLKKVVDERLASDNDFNTRIKDLTDAEKATEISRRREEITGEEYAKASTIAKDQKARAEKAEKDRDEFKSKIPAAADQGGKKDGDLSQADMYLLTTRQIHPEDVAIVQQAAKVLGLDIKGALDNPIVQSQIATEVEKRKSAGAADKGDGGRGGAAGDSDEQFRQKLAGGYIPPAGSPDAEREWKLRRQNSSVGR